MTLLLLDKVGAAVAESGLLRAVADVAPDGGRAFALGRTRVRRLRPREIEALRQDGNRAEDWSRIRVAQGFAAGRVQGCRFHGDVVLGRFNDHSALETGVRVPTGVFDSTLADCVIGHNALVRDVKLLANYVVAPGAVVFDCGRVVCQSGTAFGNGAVVPMALQGGGRDVAVYAEIDVAVAAAVVRAGRDQRLKDAYARAVGRYCELATSPRGIIESGARIVHTPSVENAYVGPHARIENATSVAECTLLSSADEPAVIESGAAVRGSLLQWGSRVATMAIVERSVLTEHAHAERHARVTDSLLGPNTAIAAGEVTSCLLGPFVASHHQALLIATFWPEGKGNVGCGANVGSNHTSRAPDQEFRAGESLFIGLGVNVKFPADFSQAPYTVLSCGMTLLPQKVTFPFSLITLPSRTYAGISPALGEILPGWMLADNLYALRRNEAKYRARNQARRARFDFAVLRPDTVELMRDACRRLESVSQLRELYTERDIEGLGKNFLLEPSRRRAIETYRRQILLYALEGLKEQADQALACGGGDEAAALLRVPMPQDSHWEHQRRILTDDYGLTDVAGALRQLAVLVELSARDVEHSRSRDAERGARIIDDYAEVHLPLAQDPLVRETWQQTHRLLAEVSALVAALDSVRSRRAADTERRLVSSLSSVTSIAV
jgi:NDP-sugar pyrophosphorylase family protein